jgi:AcrR family transcriptional regulator
METGRSKLSKDEARRRYVEIAELVALEQIRADCELLERQSIAVGPFARLDANAVAARNGKTRGAVTNLFGSQSALQVETMALALWARELIEQIEHPRPEDFASAEEWVDALCTSESARGPEHGAEPAVSYGSLWALWLGAVPYGLWSEEISRPSIEEFRESIQALEQALEGALRHFGLSLRPDVTIGDLACAFASMIEGVWLNQCLSGRHPADGSEPVAILLRRSGRLLWRGATEPRDAASE